jgi:exopolyphosphatase/guanosine-5'-triphosphate,3'-diphosphate pyrophosphatase
LDTSAPANTFAALDLGSNSFHLLIARFDGGKLEVIDRHKEMVRLASGLSDSGFLSRAAIDRGLDALRRIAERLASTPTASLRVVGTNTLRSAINSDTFMARAEEILQSPIHIISGMEEARLIYLGVAHDFAPDSGQRLVVDIGGGSTELIIGENQPIELESLHMGCVSYSKRFFPEGRISAKAYRKAVLAAREEISSIAHRFRREHWQEAVGASGTIRAIEAILDGMNLNSHNTITRAGLDQLADALCTFELADEVKLPNLTADRKAVLPGGLAVLHALFEELDIEQMHVSAYAIREGVVLDLAGRLHNHDIRSDTVTRMMRQYRADEAQAARVGQLAAQLLEQVRADFGDDAERVRKILDWSIKLHEIGLSVAHSGYHKHGAYLLENSDMPGFSKQEQKQMSFLVLNHRRKLRPLAETYGFEPDWRLVKILRLACLFMRCRDASGLHANLQIRFSDDNLILQLSRTWLDANPLTAESLEAEQKILKAIDLNLTIHPA